MDTKYRSPSRTLQHGFFTSQQTTFAANRSWEQAVARSYERSTTHFSSAGKGVFQHAQNVLGAVLKQMNEKQGDDLQALTERYKLSKPDVATAIERLETLKNAATDKTHHKDDRYSLMAAAHAAYARKLDEKSHKAASKRGPYSRPTPPPATL
jgi:hypothetical protein